MADAIVHEVVSQRLAEDDYAPCIYSIFEEGDYYLQRFRTALARRAGGASKTDPLQVLIEDIVRHEPSIKRTELEQRLGDHLHLSPIEDIDEGGIWFAYSDGRTKRAPLTGLKDRLSRAKKKINRADRFARLLG